MIEILDGPTEAEKLQLCTVAEVKENMRLRHSVEDDKVKRAILSAYDFHDGPNGWLNRTLLPRNYRMRRPGFTNPQFRVDDQNAPGYAWVKATRIEIPLPPLIEVVSVRYYGTDGTLETLYAPGESNPVTSELFSVHAGQEFPYLALGDQKNWPDTGVRDDAVEIIFRAGYPSVDWIRDNAFGIVQGIALMAGHFFQNPSQTMIVDQRNVPVAIQHGINATSGRYRIFHRMV